MNLFIDNKSGAPIYDQIYSQIKNEIIRGRLIKDQMLPSIRALAKDLRISVITTKRAYEKLENEGFIYTLPAKGCFVAGADIGLIKEEYLSKIRCHLREVAGLAAACEITKEDIIKLYESSEEESK